MQNALTSSPTTPPLWFKPFSPGWLQVSLSGLPIPVLSYSILFDTQDPRGEHKQQRSAQKPSRPSPLTQRKSQSSYSGLESPSFSESQLSFLSPPALHPTPPGFSGLTKHPPTSRPGVCCFLCLEKTLSPPRVCTAHSPSSFRRRFQGVGPLPSCSRLLSLLLWDLAGGGWTPKNCVSQASLSGPPACWVQPLRSMRSMWTDGRVRPFSSSRAASSSVWGADTAPPRPPGENQPQALVRSLAECNGHFPVLGIWVASSSWLASQPFHHLGNSAPVLHSLFLNDRNWFLFSSFNHYSRTWWTSNHLRLPRLPSQLDSFLESLSLPDTVFNAIYRSSRMSPLLLLHLCAIIPYILLCTIHRRYSVHAGPMSK